MVLEVDALKKLYQHQMHVGMCVCVWEVKTIRRRNDLTQE